MITLAAHVLRKRGAISVYYSHNCCLLFPFVIPISFSNLFPILFPSLSSMLLLFSLDCIIPYSGAFLILVNFGFDSIPLYVSAGAPSIFRWF